MKLRRLTTIYGNAGTHTGLGQDWTIYLPRQDKKGLGGTMLLFFMVLQTYLTKGICAHFLHRTRTIGVFGVVVRARPLARYSGRQITQVFGTLDWNLHTITYIMVTVRSMFVGVSMTITNVFYIGHYGTLFGRYKHRGNFRGKTKGVYVQRDGISPLTLRVFTLLFHFFNYVNCFVRLVHVFLVDSFVQLITVMVQRKNRYGRNTHFAVRGGTMTTLYQVFLGHSLGFFFGVVLGHNICHWVR